MDHTCNRARQGKACAACKESKELKEKREKKAKLMSTIIAWDQTNALV